MDRIGLDPWRLRPIGDIAAAAYTPNGGWYSHRDDETDTTSVAFGGFAGDEPDAGGLRVA